ncbi:MAG: SDR family NAD(P)-dependent oxidoreductase [Candidatus Paceibacterota bacterium]|jgi:2-deoxy-D-gluconate 3-dehydrogenase
MEQKPISELLDLKGKVAIVTGGAMGIGLAIATRLAEAGAKVLIANLDAEKSTEAVAKLTERGCTASSVVADVSDEAQVEAMVAKAVSEFGGVDILVNNAGIYPNIPVLEATKEDFEKTIHVNLKGAFFASRAAAKQMVAQGRGGSIINITSIDALHPLTVGLAFYDASKHGLWGFTKNLALELAPHRIWVNAIAPGGVATPGTDFWEGGTAEEQKFTNDFIAKVPMHRIADADEIGKVALFLASDMASYMTGSQIVVDGGTLLA